jgi:hypothetical protein
VEGRRDRPKQTFGGSDVFHSVPFTGVAKDLWASIVSYRPKTYPSTLHEALKQSFPTCYQDQLKSKIQDLRPPLPCQLLD